MINDKAPNRQAKEASPRDKWEWERTVLASDLKPTERLLLLSLSVFMNADGTRCHPSVPRIAKSMGVRSESVVYEALREVKRKGWLTVVSGGGTRKTNTYVPLIPEQSQQSGSHPTVAGATVVTTEALEPSGHAEGSETVETAKPSGSPEAKPSGSPDPTRPLDQTNGYPPQPPSHDRQAVEGLLNEHWGKRGRRHGQYTEDVVRLLARGWAWDDVRWLVTSKLADAKGVAALRWRLGRVRVATPEEARRDGQLAPALNGVQIRNGGPLSSTPTRPGTIAEHGDISGAVDWGGGGRLSSTPGTAEEHGPTSTRLESW